MNPKQVALGWDGHRLIMLVWFSNNEPFQLWARVDEGWSQLAPSRLPPPRLNAALAWDPKRSRLVLYGGHYFNDMWEWDGADWLPVAPKFWPSVGESFGLAFDPRAERVFLHNGSSSWTYVP